MWHFLDVVARISNLVVYTVVGASVQLFTLALFLTVPCWVLSFFLVNLAEYQEELSEALKWLLTLEVRSVLILLISLGLNESLYEKMAPLVWVTTLGFLVFEPWDVTTIYLSTVAFFMYFFGR